MVGLMSCFHFSFTTRNFHGTFIKIIMRPFQVSSDAVRITKTKTKTSPRLRVRPRPNECETRPSEV